MSRTPIEVVQAVLANSTNLQALSELVTEDVTYVALNYENTELKKVLPWAGTGYGPQHIVDTFTSVGKYWKFEAFEVKEIFGSGDNVAVFGSVTIKSNTLGKTVTSPFSILAKVTADKVSYFQFLEDSFGSASTFRTEGVWHFQANPNGAEVQLGAIKA